MATGALPGSRPAGGTDLPDRLAAEVAAALRLLPTGRGGAAAPLAPVLFRFILAGGAAPGGRADAPREVRIGLTPDRLDIVDSAPAAAREASRGG